MAFYAPVGYPLFWGNGWFDDDCCGNFNNGCDNADIEKTIVKKTSNTNGNINISNSIVLAANINVDVDVDIAINIQVLLELLSNNNIDIALVIQLLLNAGIITQEQVDEATNKVLKKQANKVNKQQSSPTIDLSSLLKNMKLPKQ